MTHTKWDEVLPSRETSRPLRSEFWYSAMKFWNAALRKKKVVKVQQNFPITPLAEHSVVPGGTLSYYMEIMGKWQMLLNSRALIKLGVTAASTLVSHDSLGIMKTSCSLPIVTIQEQIKSKAGFSSSSFNITGIYVHECKVFVNCEILM